MTTDKMREALEASANAIERILDQYPEESVVFGIDFGALLKAQRAALAATSAAPAVGVPDTAVSAAIDAYWHSGERQSGCTMFEAMRLAIAAALASAPSPQARLTDAEADALIEKHLTSYWTYGAAEQDRLRSLCRTFGPQAQAEPYAWIQRTKGYAPRLFLISDTDPRKHEWADDVAYELLYAGPQAQADEARDAAPNGEWFCERHPELLMGHEGCEGAGIPQEAQVPLLVNQRRLLQQEVRETATHRDDLVAQLRAAMKGPA